MFMYTSHMVEVQYHIQYECANVLLKKKKHKTSNIKWWRKRWRIIRISYLRIIFMIQVEVSISLVWYNDEYWKETFGILN